MAVAAKRGVPAGRYNIAVRNADEADGTARVRRAKHPERLQLLRYNVRCPPSRGRVEKAVRQLEGQDAAAMVADQQQAKARAEIYG